MALIATVGAADANSYVTLAEANDYFLNHPYASTWSSADNREEALIYATILLDTMVTWFGITQTTTQALQWPRSNIEGVNEDTIPIPVKYATHELALHLVSNSQLFDEETLRELEVGPINLKFNVDDIIQVLPRLVLAFISVYGQARTGNAGAVQNVKLIRV